MKSLASQTNNDQIDCDSDMQMYLSNDVSSEVDLPTEFTNKIIDVIKSKKHSDHQSSESLSAEFIPTYEDSSQHTKQQKKQVSLNDKFNISNQRLINISKNRQQFTQNTYNIKKKRQSLEQQQQQYKPNKTRNTIKMLQKSKGRGRPRIQPNPQPKKIVKKVQEKFDFYKQMKQHLQDHLTIIIKKMQDVTNQKLLAIINRIEQLQKKMAEAPQPSRAFQKQKTDEGGSVNDVPVSKTHYIKIQTKVKEIEGIERGDTTIQQVAIRLDVPMQVVRNWISNKQRLRLSLYRKMHRPNKQYHFE